MKVCSHLHKLGAAQVEHELRVEGHLVRQLEGGRVVLAVVAESAGQPDERAVQPPRRVKVVLLLAQARERMMQRIDIVSQEQTACGTATSSRRRRPPAPPQEDAIELQAFPLGSKSQHRG